MTAAPEMTAPVVATPVAAAPKAAAPAVVAPDAAVPEVASPNTALTETAKDHTVMDMDSPIRKPPSLADTSEAYSDPARTPPSVRESHMSASPLLRQQFELRRAASEKAMPSAREMEQAAADQRVRDAAEADKQCLRDERKRERLEAIRRPSYVAPSAPRTSFSPGAVRDVTRGQQSAQARSEQEGKVHTSGKNAEVRQLM